MIRLYYLNGRHVEWILEEVRNSRVRNDTPLLFNCFINRGPSKSDICYQI